MALQDRLVRAAAAGLVRQVERFLVEGAGLNEESKDGRTALIAAATHGRSEAVDFLLNQNADVNHKTQRGETALKSSWRNGHLGIAEALIGACAQPDKEDIQGLLFLASEKKDPALIELVVNKGADVNAPNPSGKTALRTACESRNFEIARLLLTRGASFEQESKMDLIACAALGGDRHLVQMILGAATDIESVLEMQGIALSAACSGGQTALVRFCLKEFQDLTTETLVNSFKIALSAGHRGAGAAFQEQGLFFRFVITDSWSVQVDNIPETWGMGEWGGWGDHNLTVKHFEGEAWIERIDEKNSHRLAWCRWKACGDLSQIQIQEGDESLLPLIKGGQ